MTEKTPQMSEQTVMANIIDPYAEGVIETPPSPLLIRMCSFEFLDASSPKSALGCIAMTGKQRDFVFISSHRHHADNPSRFIFEVGLETLPGSCFRNMLFTAIRNGRGFILKGEWIPSHEVEQWFCPDGSAAKTNPKIPPQPITDWFRNDGEKQKRRDKR